MSAGKFLIYGAALAVAMSAGTAGAVVAPKPKVLFQAGTTKVPSWTTATVFQNFESAKLNTVFDPYYKATSGKLAAGGTWKETSRTSFVSYAGYVAGEGQSKTLTALGNYAVSFSLPQQYLSFVIQAPAIDSSILNLVLSFENGTSARYTSLASLGIGGFASLLGGRVNFDMGGQSGIKSFSIRGATIDDLASAAPEPATWGMMILGFGMLGAAMRRQRKVRTTVRFA